MSLIDKLFPNSLPTRAAKPFLKWVGGKQQLLAQFEPFFPKEIERYIEPFIGGGAVFFYLWNLNRIQNDVHLFDHNPELITTYRVIRDQVEALIEQLAIYKQAHNPLHYYQIRAQDRDNRPLTDVERAARMIYLNRTCYNGLFRVNSKGYFNVPIGSYVDPKILSEVTLRNAHLALQQVELRVQDFRDLVAFARAGDFIYFDPPYHPVSKTASFTSYTSSSFGDSDQQALAEVYARLSEKGCYCMLSNSHTPFILDLYRNFRIETVSANRAINSKASSRGAIKEVVILNYEDQST